MDINLTPKAIFARNAVAQRIMQAHANMARITGMRSAPASRSSYCAHIDKLDAERVAKRNGHAGEGGLQKHSVGNLYPLAVVGWGDGSFTVEHLTSGQRFDRFDNSAAAFDKAHALKAAA